MQTRGFLCPPTLGTLGGHRELSVCVLRELNSRLYVNQVCGAQAAAADLPLFMPPSHVKGLQEHVS